MALVGVAPLDMPTFAFDSGGTTSYDNASNAFSVSSTPLYADILPPVPGELGPNESIFFSGTLDINIEVDGSGNLVGGVPGDDLVLIEAGGSVASGQTAGGGFWQNKNGQELTESVSEGLGDWLAATLPNLYGDDGDGDVNPFDLTGKTNAEVAEFIKTEFKKKNKGQPPGPAKLNSQVLASAIAVYVTNSNVAGLAGLSFGITVTETGVGTSTINVGDNGEAFGVADGTGVTVLDALFAVDSFNQEGLLYDDYDMDLFGDGTIDALELALRTAANQVFSMINDSGGI